MVLFPQQPAPFGAPGSPAQWTCGCNCVKPIGCVLTGFTRGLAGFNLTTGFNSGHRFWLSDAFDDIVPTLVASQSSRLTLIPPGAPRGLVARQYPNQQQPPQSVLGGMDGALQAAPKILNGFDTPDDTSVTFRINGSAIELRLVLYLTVPYGVQFGASSTYMVQATYRKDNQIAFFNTSQPGTKLVFTPADVISFSVVRALIPQLTSRTEPAIVQGDLGNVTVGFLGQYEDLSTGEFAVTITAQTPSYSYTATNYTTPRTLTHSFAGLNAVTVQAETQFFEPLTMLSGESGGCSKWAFQLYHRDTQVLYVLAGGSVDNAFFAPNAECIYSSTSFNAGISAVAFALLKDGNSMTVQLPALSWNGETQLLWNRSPGFGSRAPLDISGMGVEQLHDTFLPNQGIPFRHGSATLTLAKL